jgi:hypothetical protein
MGVHARYGACQCVELGVVFLLGLRRERIRRLEQVLQIPCANPNDHDPQPFCQVTYVRKTGLVEGEPKNHTSRTVPASFPDDLGAVADAFDSAADGRGVQTRCVSRRIYSPPGSFATYVS